ncbi:hypothetical protein PR202_gb13276 [Eleusine coracana subsp. coracana]|uniref:Uncharacterized protein n=1 Tax=Eleusine coracana subsp. coracana TaxID=191504 RepID=A0AAV5EQ54_ELECO|nr:hypothetical protein PR202_gb13276 [Eleusine coracana subsp. coracana]
MLLSVTIARRNSLLDLAVALVICSGTVLLAWLKLSALIGPKPCYVTMLMELCVHEIMIRILLV